MVKYKFLAKQCHFLTLKHFFMKKILFGRLLSKLVQAVGVPVGWCSGGRLATMLVATNTILIFFII